MKIFSVILACLAAARADVSSLPSSQYLPANQQPTNTYLPPNNQYLPPSNTYLPPQTQQPNNQYLPPSTQQPNNQYLPPQTQQPNKQYLPPQTQQPNNQYLPPQTQQPNNQYLPPQARPTNAYLPPSTSYGTPSQSSRPSSTYGAPSAPSAGYGAPTTSYGTPAVDNAYLPPTSGGGYGYGGQGGYDDQSEPANYEFEYKVNDPPSGNDFGHKESRQGDVAEGKYYVLLPDGRLQTVEYTADSEGYKPRISYQQVGTGAGGYQNGGYPSGGGGGYQYRK